MFLYIEKLLPTFVFPLGLALAVSLVALALLIACRPVAARMFLTIAVVGLWVSSMPGIADLITTPLEDQNSPRPIATAQPADAIIVLGGGIAKPRARLSEPEFGPAAARLFAAYSLWRAGKGKLILISGGNLPWEQLPRPEAELAAEVLQQLGVPRAALLIEGESRNTHENARNTAVIWREKGIQSGLLVTSAMHMPRALATFRAAGLDVEPWPTDFRAQQPTAKSIFDFIPDAGALAATTAAAKEWLGLVVYRWRGWA
ncbi:YdcF family protein [Bradyrhizobium sp. ORS 111]|uniref:YdcF family protein n=1 Tax=Bradyrhizobium sp. ORS 111 TaxID=1685958 RepID=UPI00388E51A5